MIGSRVNDAGSISLETCGVIRSFSNQVGAIQNGGHAPGTEPKRVIVRAIGPELTQYGVPDPLADPTLELHDGTGALIASNDNWPNTIIRRDYHRKPGTRDPEQWVGSRKPKRVGDDRNAATG